MGRDRLRQCDDLVARRTDKKLEIVRHPAHARCARDPRGASRAEIARSSLGEDKAGSADGPRAKWSLTNARTLRRGALHDLRRTASTVMHELGRAASYRRGGLGPHRGHKGGVSGVYNKAAYRTEKAAALALWAEHVLALVEGRPAKIVSLRA